MTTEPTNRDRQAAIEEIIEQATILSNDYGIEVVDAVKLATEEPLDPVRAERLWTRIITILRSAGREINDDGRRRLAEQVKEEVRGVIESVARPTATRRRQIDLCEKHGVQPYDVLPIPTYNGTAIPMRCGYVDANELSLWRGNHRLELQVKEFQERHHRDPEDHEVLAIMQGTLHLPSLADKDPFEVLPLANSIARKGVENPPILTADGQPKDGNRRIAAAKYVVTHPEQFNPEQVERARWIRVWLAPRWTTDEQFEAIVVSQNFEPELKLPWPEYVKARLVSERWETLREGCPGRFTEVTNKRIKQQVADQFAISVGDVTRYLRMVAWARDFETFHIDERNRDKAAVRYRANDIFQWFYEIDAGRGNQKLSNRLDADDELKSVVYDLMYDVLDSGALVRDLHKMVADDDTASMLIRAHEQAAGGSSSDRELALEIVKEADAEVRRRSIARRKIGFDQWLRNAVDKLGSTAPDDWSKITDTDLLVDLRRVFHAAIGAVEGVIEARGHDLAADEVDTSVDDPFVGIP